MTARAGHPRDTPRPSESRCGHQDREGATSPSSPLTVAIPDGVVTAIAERAAELAAAILSSSARSPYLTVVEAAEYLRAKPQRVYDLLSARRLTRHKDGRRVLVSRAELDAYLAGEPAQL